MKCRVKLGLFLLVLYAAGAWANDDVVADICKKLSSIDFPKQDQVQTQIIKPCESMKFYYDIGVNKDYAKARYCAFLEKAAGDNLVFGGSSILMMIYANGQGVQRNLDLATKLACQIGGAPLEMGERVNHLQELKSKPQTTLFDLCDDISSGFMQGQCALKEAKIADAKRDTIISQLSASWPLRHRQALANLRQTAHLFFNSRIENEVDLSGTARSAMQSEEQESLEINFEKSLSDFENRKLPEFSATDFKQKDSELNAVYNRIMHTKSRNLLWGTVTAGQIKRTQKIWLRYRDAWIKFALIHYPQVSTDSFKTWITMQRIEQLEEFTS